MPLDLDLSGELETEISPTLMELENVSAPAMMEENSISIETTHPCSRNEDEEVDVTGFTNSGRASVAQDTCGDETDYSSSFGDTGSDEENASFSDPEVESRICADTTSSSNYNDWHKSYQRRKKSMTAHWRKFIRPIEWRCKWVELRLKQLQLQAEKYEKDLAAYNYTKEVDLAHLTLDGSSIRSVPISRRVRRNKVLKRNKGRKVEENCDLASYMSNHNLFSYYNEKVNCVVDAHSKDSREVALGGDDNGNMVEFKLNDLWSSDKNDSTDKSMVEIIEKLEAAQSQLRNLKTRLDKVISDNPGKLCSANLLSVLEPYDRLNHSDPNRASSDYEGIIPLAEATDRPEYNFNLLEDIMDVDLIENPVNPVANEELHDLEIVGNQVVKKTKEPIEEKKAISQVQVPAPDSSENAVHRMHHSLRRCNILNKTIPKNKRTAVKMPSDQMKRDRRDIWLALLHQHGLRN